MSSEFAQDDRTVYAELSALHGGYIDLPEREFVNDPDPNVVRRCPSLCFLVKHPPTGKQIVFDLGLRKNWHEYPEPLSKRFSSGERVIDVSTDVIDSLKVGNIQPESITDVMFSHIHYDHIGDYRQFPNAKFIVGSETQNIIDGKKDYPALYCGPTMIPSESQFKFLPPANVNDPNSGWKPKGPFPATYDYFGDGSVIVVDAPGHLPGHICLIVKTGPKKYYYLGGDMCHDIRVISGEKKISSYCDMCGNTLSYYVDIPTAQKTVETAAKWEKDKDIKAEIIIAHHPHYKFDQGPNMKYFFPGKFPSS